MLQASEQQPPRRRSRCRYRTEPATTARQCRARPHAAGTTRQSPEAGLPRTLPNRRATYAALPADRLR